MVEEVSLSEALMHFFQITWKFIFAVVPPVHWSNGYPAFFCALAMIGVITGIVG